ncbi:hypothetical protein D3C84_247990 [compost metagenome]
MLKETVSLELLNVKAKRALGIRIEAIVEQWITRREFSYFYTSEQLVELATIVKEEMGVNVEFVMNPNPYVNAAASIIQLPGHSGSTYNGPGTKPMTVVGRDVPQALRKIKIDLDKGKITGEIINDMRNRITLFAGLVSDPIALTAEEITAVIVHELGHVWNQFFALGDYVWLNYYLQDGLEVLSGKKPNIYKLEILTEAGLDKYCDDKDALEAMRAAPTAKNVRRAILIAAMKAPRQHLSATETNISRLREEQLADMFASRMGYARASVSLHVKTTKKFGSRYTIGSNAMAFMETTKVLLNVGALATAVAAIALPPLLVAALALRITALCMTDYNVTKPEQYDNDIERPMKFRRDLVAQLKILGEDKSLEEKILEDIRVIDDLLAIYSKNTTLWEAFQLLVNPSFRRNRHQRAREEELEQLLNNDLFVAAAKFNTLSRTL